MIGDVMTYDQEERAYLKKLWEDSFRDLEWKLVKREAFKYVFQNETLDGLDDHLRELRTHIALRNDRKATRTRG
jgi:hypothetical protein